MEGIERIAAKGRFGDNHLLHVSDAEVQGLNSLARSMYGHDLTTNPDTGLPEAFLFAPLLAPALLGSTSLGLGATLGTGALATGLTAGALGAAEAAARGMDDPLQQGLMAGMTAGAGSAIGSSLQGAADAAQAAGGAGALGGADVGAIASTGPDLSSTIATTPDVSQAVVGMPASTPSYNLPSNAPQFTAGNQAVANMSPSQMQAFENSVQLQSDIAQGFVPSAPAAPTGPFAGMQKSFEGAKAIATGAPGAPTMGQFIKQNQMPLAIGAAGLSGQQQLGAQQEMREKKEEMDAQKAAKLKATQDIIRRNYANVGRALPMNPYTNRPVFEQGGIVGLMGGGRPFDSAPRYLETGGMLGDGMSDDIPAMIDGDQPAALSDGEFVIPADVVSHLGNGSSDAGAQQLYSMMDRIRQARTGNKEQGKEINPKKYMPA